MSIKLATLNLSAPKQSGLFSPTAEQLRLKCKFWLKYTEDGGQPHDSVDLVLVAKYIRAPKLGDWWTKQEGFSDWFSENSEFRHRAEYLGERSLDTVEELMTNPDVPANTRLGAARLGLELSGKLGKNAQAAESADEQIARMTRQQLVEFIAKSAAKLPEVRNLILDSSEDK